MFILKSLLLTLAGATGAAFAASASQPSVVLERPVLSQPGIGKAVDDWCQSAASATNGRLSCAGPRPQASGDVLMELKSGKLGLAVITHQDYPHVFPVSRVAELPRLGDFAETVSVAYQRAFAASPAMAAEHQGLKVLTVFTQAPSFFFFSSGRVDTANGLRSRTMTVLRPTDEAVASGLGMKVAPPGSASSIPSRVARISTASEVLRSNGADLLSTAAMVPGGLANVSYAFAMEEKLWRTLSPADREAVEGISGEQLARSFGRLLDAAEWKANMKERGNGVVFYSPDDAVTAQVQQRLKSVDQVWIATARKSGVSRPDKVLERLRQVITTLELAE